MEQLDTPGIFEILKFQTRSIWLPKPKLGIQLDFTPIIEVFQNVAYMGELRARWLEIKRLQAKPAYYHAF